MPKEHVRRLTERFIFSTVMPVCCLCNNLNGTIFLKIITLTHAVFMRSICLVSTIFQRCVWIERVKQLYTRLNRAVYLGLNFLRLFAFFEWTLTPRFVNFFPPSLNRILLLQLLTDHRLIIVVLFTFRFHRVFMLKFTFNPIGF